MCNKNKITKLSHFAGRVIVKFMSGKYEKGLTEIITLMGGIH